MPDSSWLAEPCLLYTSLVELPASEERALRDQIDSLAVDEAKCEHAVDLAQDNFATSKAAYEALLETDDERAQRERARRQRSVQVGLSIALPLMLSLIHIYPRPSHRRLCRKLPTCVVGLHRADSDRRLSRSVGFALEKMANGG